MKVVPLSEAKAKLNRYAHLCHDERCCNGQRQAFFQLITLEEDDELIDRTIEHIRAFASFWRGDLREHNVSVDIASRRPATAVSAEGAQGPPRLRRSEIEAGEDGVRPSGDVPVQTVYSAVQ